MANERSRTGEPRRSQRVWTAVTTQPWPAWFGARAVAFAVGLLTWGINRGNVFIDITGYGRWAFGTLNGTAIPYRDFAWEYPPMAMPGMLGPAIVTAVLPTWRYIPYLVAWIAMVLRHRRADHAGDHPPGRHRRSPPRAPGLDPRAAAPGRPVLDALRHPRRGLRLRRDPPGRIPPVGGIGSRFRRRRDAQALAQPARARPAHPWPRVPGDRSSQGSRCSRSPESPSSSRARPASRRCSTTSRTVACRSSRSPALPLVWLHHLGVAGYGTRFAYGAFEITGPGVPPTGEDGHGGLRHRAAAGVPRALAPHASRRTSARGGADRGDPAPRHPRDEQGLQPAVRPVAARGGRRGRDPRPGHVADGTCLRSWCCAGLTQIVFPLFYGDVLFGAWFGLIAMTVRDLRAALPALHGGGRPGPRAARTQQREREVDLTPAARAGAGTTIDLAMAGSDTPDRRPRRRHRPAAQLRRLTPRPLVSRRRGRTPRPSPRSGSRDRAPGRAARPGWSARGWPPPSARAPRPRGPGAAESSSRGVQGGSAPMKTPSSSIGGR